MSETGLYCPVCRSRIDSGSIVASCPRCSWDLQTDPCRWPRLAPMSAWEIDNYIEHVQAARRESGISNQDIEPVDNQPQNTERPVLEANPIMEDLLNNLSARQIDNFGIASLAGIAGMTPGQVRAYLKDRGFEAEPERASVGSFAVTQEGCKETDGSGAAISAEMKGPFPPGNGDEASINRLFIEDGQLPGLIPPAPQMQSGSSGHGTGNAGDSARDTWPQRIIDGLDNLKVTPGRAGEVYINFNWPSGLDSLRLIARSDAFARQAGESGDRAWTVNRRQYEHEGGVLVRQNHAGTLFISMFAVPDAGFSRPLATVNIDFRIVTPVRYAMRRPGIFRGGSYWLDFTVDTASPGLVVPGIQIMARHDSMPLHKNDGQVLQIMSPFRADSFQPFSVALRRPGGRSFVKAFFREDSSYKFFKLLSPPVKDLIVK